MRLDEILKDREPWTVYLKENADGSIDAFGKTDKENYGLRESAELMKKHGEVVRENAIRSVERMFDLCKKYGDLEAVSIVASGARIDMEYDGVYPLVIIKNKII